MKNWKKAEQYIHLGQVLTSKKDNGTWNETTKWKVFKKVKDIIKRNLVNILKKWNICWMNHGNEQNHWKTNLKIQKDEWK